MNSNLRKATGTAPIVYALTSATMGAARNGTFPINVRGQLTMHGTTRSVPITAQAKSLGGKRFQVTGSVPVTMSQYGIDPPRAMMGTMRTGDQTTVRFNVTINAGS
jgi:polyisoprenoid-binding protein YceI